MADMVEAFATTTDRSPRSTLTTIDNRQVLRTVYPSLANEQSCVTCHNQLQPDKVQWRLNDVMGAFAIDIPVATFLQASGRKATRSRSRLFLALAGIGLAVSILHFRQLNEREWSAEHVQTQNIRFNAALNNMSQGLCMFDSDKRLVVYNERYAKLYSLPPELLEPGTSHEAIIKHRIASGILAKSEREQFTALNKHSPDAVSSRTDKLNDGRQIKVVRAPMPGGGWVATHEDVTEQAHRDSIDSAIKSFRERVESVLATVSDSHQCDEVDGDRPVRIVRADLAARQGHPAVVAGRVDQRRERRRLHPPDVRPPPARSASRSLRPPRSCTAP